MPFTTRIAPSPTGPTHMGTIRTAYINWLAARASKGQFIVRIDDTDSIRSDQRHADQFLTTLKWLRLPWDALYYQSHRLSIYQSYAQKLIDKGLACAQDKAVRLNLTAIPSVSSWIDQIAGSIKIDLANVGGFDQMYLIGSDGMPTYHFASCVDDIDLGINFVIRGKDHTTNTSKHILLYHLLDAPLPRFAHLGLLQTKQDGQVKKMSKRDATSDIATYIDQGINPDAMLNFLARLGWGPTVDDATTKLLTKDDMVKLFLGGGKMGNKDATVDFVKLASFDRKYKARVD